MKEYKKSYLGLVIIILIYFISLACLFFLKNIDLNTITHITGILTVVFVFSITFVIYLTGYIYWYNGISYEDALNKTKEERKIYAKKIMLIFLVFLSLYLIYSLFAIIFKFPYYGTILVLTVSLIVSAISTIKVKL